MLVLLLVLIGDGIEPIRRGDMDDDVLVGVEKEESNEKQIVAVGNAAAAAATDAKIIIIIVTSVPLLRGRRAGTIRRCRCRIIIIIIMSKNGVLLCSPSSRCTTIMSLVGEGWRGWKQATQGD